MSEYIERNLRPLLLLPMSEWEMRPVNDGIGDKVAVGIYARWGDDGRYTRTWFKWPWACIPNNIIGFGDLVRCGVAEHLIAHLRQQEISFLTLEAKAKLADLEAQYVVQADPT
jgi:hypothetical protein